MALPYEIVLAQRNLARHPWHTAAMVSGLALAVLVMVYIPSTMASFYDDLIDRAVEQNSAHVTVWPRERRRGQLNRALRREFGQAAAVALVDRTYPRRHDLNGHHALAEKVASTPGVAAVAAFAKGNATVSQGRVNMGIVLEGIEPDDYARVINIARHFPGNQVPKLGPSEVAIGFRMAEKLSAHVGEHIRVATPTTQRVLRVKAVFRSGYYDKDLRHAYVHLATAQRMFGMGNEVSGLAARCRHLDQAAATSRLLSRRLEQKIRNWRDDNASLLAEIATVKRVTLFINVLVAMVASAGMANVFSMFVLNRQKELSILRAMGASQISMRGILLLESLFIWLVGTIVGFTLVLTVMAYEQTHPYKVSAETYGIGSYATQPKPAFFLVASVLAAATMGLSAWWSGRKAAKLNPIEVIFGR